MNKIKLKPCPFCGSKAKLHEIKEGDNEGGEYIECIGCKASTSLMFPLKEDVKELLIEKWNNRVKPMYNMYDFNQAYEGFVFRFGIEPNGILMSEETYDILKQPMEAFVIAIKEPTTFRGIPIMRSQQMEPNQIRFVI